MSESEWFVTLGYECIESECQPTVHVSIRNYCRGNGIDYETLRNTLEISDDTWTRENQSGIEIPLRQADCYRLGMMFLRAYQDESWTNGAEPRPVDE